MDFDFDNIGKSFEQLSSTFGEAKTELGLVGSEMCIRDRD